MPSSGGVHTLPPGYLAVTGATIQASQHNPPLEDLSAGLTARLSRDGSAPMIGPLLLASGAAAAPGQAFAVDPSSGFYKTASGIGIAIAGTKVAEFLPGGVVGARYIGELIPCVLSTAPALCVFPVGQTLSRTTYAGLWAVAQVEIAAGNTFFNNGDGSTTFGIGDLRGRVIATKDSSGAILTSGTMAPNGNTIGATGGAQTVALLTSNLPPYTPAGTVGVAITTPNVLSGGVSDNYSSVGGTGTWNSPTRGSLAATGSFTGAAQGGTSTPVNKMQPTMLANYALFAGA